MDALLKCAIPTLLTCIHNVHVYGSNLKSVSLALLSGTLEMELSHQLTMAAKSFCIIFFCRTIKNFSLELANKYRQIGISASIVTQTVRQ